MDELKQFWPNLLIIAIGVALLVIMGLLSGGAL